VLLEIWVVFWLDPVVVCATILLCLFQARRAAGGIMLFICAFVHRLRNAWTWCFDKKLSCCKQIVHQHSNTHSVTKVNFQGWWCFSRGEGEHMEHSARCINLVWDSFSWGIGFYREETFVTPLIAWLLLCDRGCSRRKHKIHGGWIVFHREETFVTSLMSIASQQLCCKRSKVT